MSLDRPEKMRDVLELDGLNDMPDKRAGLSGAQLARAVAPQNRVMVPPILSQPVTDGPQAEPFHHLW